MNVSRHSVSHILCDDLHLGAYHRCVSHILTDKLKKKNGFDRCKKLLKRFAKKKHRKILFSDEKIFTIEEKFNPQNDRVYARNCYEAKEKVPRVQHAQQPPSAMVWWRVSYFGATEIHFCESGGNTNRAIYWKLLQDVVEPLSDTLFEGVEDWCFQQDSAPAHKAKATQKWCEDFLLNFITVEQWCSGSPDLNPLDYQLWTDLEAIVCKRRHRNLKSLMAAIGKVVQEFPFEKIREAIDEWPKRLWRHVQSKGGHFE